MGQDESAVVAGHLCLDIIPDLGHLSAGEFDALFQPGHLIEVGPAAFSGGGAVSNTGLVLHRLGIQTHLMGRIGADSFGQALTEFIHSFDPRLVEGIRIDPDSNTSYTLIVSPPGIDRIFLHHSGSNDCFASEDIDFARVSRSQLFHFGYPTAMKRMYQGQGEELVRLLRQAKGTGVTTSLDLSFPDPSSQSGRTDWRAILESALPFVDIFLPSIEELLVMLQPDVYGRLREKAGSADLLPWITPELLAEVSAGLLGMGVKMLVIKLGRKGIYLRTAALPALADFGRAGPDDLPAWGARELWAPAFRVKVAGTTGAGDSAIAGFLSALLRQKSPHEALVIAAAVGACNVESPDALSGILPWTAVLRRIGACWERLPLDLPPRWRWEQDAGVWLGPQDAWS